MVIKAFKVYNFIWVGGMRGTCLQKKFRFIMIFFLTDGLSSLQKPTTRNRKLKTGHRNQEWGNTETEKPKRGTGKTGWFVRIVQFLTLCMFFSDTIQLHANDM